MVQTGSPLFQKAFSLLLPSLTPVSVRAEITETECVCLEGLSDCEDRWPSFISIKAVQELLQFAKKNTVN